MQTCDALPEPRPFARFDIPGRTMMPAMDPYAATVSDHGIPPEFAPRCSGAFGGSSGSTEGAPWHVSWSPIR